MIDLTGKERRALLGRRAERNAIGRELERLAVPEVVLCRCGCGTPNLTASAGPESPERQAARLRLESRLSELEREEERAARSAAETRRRWETMRPALIASAAPSAAREPATAALVLAGDAESTLEAERRPGVLYLEPGAFGPVESSPIVFSARTGRVLSEQGSRHGG